MTDQAKGESAKAFQLQLKPHLKEGIAKKVIQKDQNEKNKIQSVSCEPNIETHNSSFNPLDVIKSLAEMKPVVIIKKDSSIQSNSRNTNYSNQCTYANRQQAINGFPGELNMLQKNELIQEDDASDLIEKHSHIGFNSLQKEDLKSALLNLRRADIIMNAYISSEGQIDMSVLYFVKINLGLLDEAFTCFETCIMSIKKQKRDPNINGILVKLYFQCCILQSEQSNHERALFLGKKATKTIITQFMDQLITLSQKLVNFQKSVMTMDVNQSQLQLSQQKNIQQKRSDQKQQIQQSDNYYYGAPFENKQKKIQQKGSSSVNSSINSGIQLFSLDQQQTSIQNTSNCNINGQNLSDLGDDIDFIQSSQQDILNNIRQGSISFQNDHQKNNLNNKGNSMQNAIQNKRKQLEIQTSAINESFYLSSQINDTQSELSGTKGDIQGILQKNSSDAQTVVSEFETQVNLRKIDVVSDLTDMEKNVYMLIKSILSKMLDMPSILSAKKFSILQGIFSNLNSEIDAIYSPLLKNDSNNSSPQRFKSSLFTTNKSTFYDKINLKDIFKTQESVLQKSNILGLLQLKPMSLESIRVSLPTEFCEKFLLFSAQISVGFYCISTEYRFIEQPQANINKDNCDEISNSENYLSRALEIAFVYLPHEVPLVGQIMSVHTKFYAAFRQCIYEDQPDQKYHILIKSLPGGCKAPFFIPLIRKKPEIFQINNLKILNTDLFQQQKDIQRQERLHLDAHPTEDFQNDSESDRGLFSEETPSGKQHILQQNFNKIIKKGTNISNMHKHQIYYTKQKRSSISRENSSEAANRKNKKSNDILEKIYKSNKDINGQTIEGNNLYQNNEYKARQNRTLDPPKKQFSISTNAVSSSLNNSFVNTPTNSSPQSRPNSNIIQIQGNNRQLKSLDRVNFDVNYSSRNVEFLNTPQSSTSTKTQQKKQGNYMNRMKILTKPPLHQRIQQMMSSQQSSVNSPSLQASQISINAHEKNIEKEVFQLQVKSQQQKQKQNDLVLNNLNNSIDETTKYKGQNNNQNQNNIYNQQQYMLSQNIDSSQNNNQIFHHNQQLNNNHYATNQSNNNQQIHNNYVNNTNQSINHNQIINNNQIINGVFVGGEGNIPSQNNPQSAPSGSINQQNSIQQRKKNFNIQINNNINFFIQNGQNNTSLNNQSLNSSFQNSNQFQDNINENIPFKSFNNTPLGTNRQLYSRQNKHKNKSQNSNINPNLSSIIQEGVVLNQDRSNSFNHPASNKRSRQYKNLNSSIHYTSAQHSPNTSLMLNNSSPQNSQALFPLSVKNKNIPSAQQILNSSLNNSPDSKFIPQQIQIQTNPQSTKSKVQPPLKEIIFFQGNPRPKIHINAQENSIQHGLSGTTKNPYINNKNLRKYKLNSELINF